MTVLIITYSQDHRGIDRVTRKLHDRGQPVIRLDSDQFPTELDLVVEQGPTGDRIQLRRDEITRPGGEITAIWNRRLRRPRLPPGMPKDVEDASAEEAKTVLRGLINSVPAFCLDPWASILGAEHKQRQLAHARDVGLTIPPTLITNSPDAVRSFAAQCPDGLVTKMLSSFALERDGEDKVVFTNTLSTDDLTDLDGLRLCPMVFQARIERVMELRCTIVGHHVFCGALHASDSAEAGDDWRRSGSSLLAKWRHHELPRPIADKLRVLATRLGLNYGAADLLVDAEGIHHFLEINPGGEYAWIERACDLPISDAIAEVLCDPQARRVDGWTP